MDDMEFLKKLFLEKEKENMKLKQEIEQIKNPDESQKNEYYSQPSSQTNEYDDQGHNTKLNESNYYSHNLIPLNISHISQNKPHLNNSAINDQIKTSRNKNQNTSYIADNLTSYKNQADLIDKDKFFSNKSARVMDLGRIYNEGEKKLNKTNIYEGNNANIVKNLENQIIELKSQVKNYEKEYKSNNLSKMQSTDNIIDEKLMKYELMIEDLQLKQKLKEEEKNQLKEMYEKELMIKADIYNQNISHLNKTNQEEIKKLRIDYENKMDELVKKSEEEKYALSSKINSIENDLINCQSKSIFNEKSEMIDFQKKYLYEMRDLQTNFEEFKIKTYEQLKTMKKQKEEAINKSNFYKESFLKIKNEFDQCVNQFKENEQKMKQKLDNVKNIYKINESLKTQLDEAKKESSYLKLQVQKLEISEKRLHNLLLEKDRTNMSGYIDYLTNGPNETMNTNQNNKSSQDYQNYIQSNPSSNFDLKFSNMFSPIKKEQSTVSLLKNPSSNNLEDYERNLPKSISEKDSVDFGENLSKLVDFKKAKERMREMEDNLKLMSHENENLKSRLDPKLSIQPTNYNDENIYSTPVARDNNNSKQHYSQQNVMKSEKKSQDLPRSQDNSSDPMSVYKKRVMDKRNTSSNMISMIEENDLNAIKKNRDMTPILKHHVQNKQISVSPYRLDHNINTSINQQIMTNRTNINVKKKFLVGKIQTDDNAISSDEFEYDTPQVHRIRHSKK